LFRSPFSLFWTTESGPKPALELKKAAASAFAAFTIAGSAMMTAPPPVDALPPAFASSSTMVAEKVVREGVYREYEVDVAPQQYDDARSTFKAAKETKSKKGESRPNRCACCYCIASQTDTILSLSQENTPHCWLFLLLVVSS